MKIAELTDTVESFIAEHDLADINVVGSLMGARMAMEMARRAHRGTVVALFPDATLHWFGDCGHFPHWSQPQQTADLILAATATPGARRG